VNGNYFGFPGLILQFKMIVMPLDNFLDFEIIFNVSLISNS